ncbi:MAG: hypothetical protein Unbinned7913contig1002_46 [Prokaryotic dsDNA virus sp.]|jgi:hypothetical protein|nr:hypothetical protein [Parcubacteria group bacterium]QDP51291.1 MAG: hypothetical protein Unbinned7913contig1002_46 [Prokaryotic dsDNA virus sp.]|tara:strand:+ start:239 stop:433 length:195 start_codon:yes stop_codon:yes gene_type:complete
MTAKENILEILAVRDKCMQEMSIKIIRAMDRDWTKRKCWLLLRLGQVLHDEALEELLLIYTGKK